MAKEKQEYKLKSGKVRVGDKTYRKGEILPSEVVSAEWPRIKDQLDPVVPTGPEAEAAWAKIQAKEAERVAELEELKAENAELKAKKAAKKAAKNAPKEKEK